MSHLASSIDVNRFLRRTNIGMVVIACTFAYPALGRAQFVYDSPMYKRPILPEISVTGELYDAKKSWLLALARPEAELKCKAAHAFARAHLAGLKGMEVAIDPLLAEFRKNDPRPDVRLSLAHALITLDAKKSAESLFEKLDEQSREYRELVEPALAKWGHDGARKHWLARLETEPPVKRDLLLAGRGLAVLGEAKAVPLLVRRLREPDPLLRLEFARILGSFVREGLEGETKILIGKSGSSMVLDKLAGVALLRSHRSQASADILLAMTKDESQVVAASAVKSLLDRDAKLLVPSAAALIVHADASVRRQIIEVIRRLPSEAGIDLLLGRFEDSHAAVRDDARKVLLGHAEKQAFRDRIIGGAEAKLASKEWGAIEQATLLLALLDQKQTARVIAKGLPHRRHEVFLASAWALRKLSAPETLPATVQYIEKRLAEITVAKRPINQDVDPWTDYQLSQLIQFVGDQRYAPADPILRKFAPRIFGDWGEARASANWALAQIHRGKTDKALSTTWIRMLNEGPPFIPPEDERVRRMAAIALAVTGDKEAVPTLRQHYIDREPSLSQVNNACCWALEQLAGEKIPPLNNRHSFWRNWFLYSLD